MKIVNVVSITFLFVIFSLTSCTKEDNISLKSEKTATQTENRSSLSVQAYYVCKGQEGLVFEGILDGDYTYSEKLRDAIQNCYGQPAYGWCDEEVESSILMLDPNDNSITQFIDASSGLPIISPEGQSIVRSMVYNQILDYKNNTPGLDLNGFGIYKLKEVECL